MWGSIFKVNSVAMTPHPPSLSPVHDLCTKGEIVPISKPGSLQMVSSVGNQVKVCDRNICVGKHIFT